MRRRNLLAGAFGLGVVGVGAHVATRGISSDVDGDAPSTESESENDNRLRPREFDRLDVRVDGSDVQWEELGTEEVPRDGVVTNVELMRTTCSGCYRKLPHLPSAYSESGGDVQFVSVLIDTVPTQTEDPRFAELWEEHGDWPLVHDPDMDIVADVRRLDGVSAVASPSSILLDERNRPVWINVGGDSASVVEELRREIAAIS